MAYYDYNPESVIVNQSEVQSSDAVTEKIQKYEEFVNEVLKNDLKYVLQQRDSVYEEISEYTKLQTYIDRVHPITKRPIKSKVNIGCEYFMQAEVKNTDYIFVDVGLGLHVQCTFEEATRVVKKRIDQLTLKAEKMTDKSCDIKSRIKLIVQALAELQGLDKDKKKPQIDIFN